jgi:hypothetical protein
MVVVEPTLTSTRRSFNRASLVAFLAGASAAFLYASTSAQQRAASGQTR